MNSKSAVCLILFCSTCIPLIEGCGRLKSPALSTATVVKSLGSPPIETYVITYFRGNSESIVIWSNIKDMPVATGESIGRGVRWTGLLSSDSGADSEWECDISAGGTGTVQIAGRFDFDLVDGNLFLVRADEGGIGVQQRRSPPMTRENWSDEIDVLAVERDISGFFSNGKPENN